jgi:hypothetical protein
MTGLRFSLPAGFAMIHRRLLRFAQGSAASRLRERGEMAAPAARLKLPESVFGLDAAGWIMSEIMAPWVQDMGLLVESVEAGRPPGAPSDWQPGAVLRLPFSNNICRDGGVVCGQALMALDQTTHFLRPVNFDVVADARIMRIGRSTSIGRATLYAASDRRPVGMVSSAYAML